MREKLIYLFLLFSLTANSQDSLFVDCYGTDASGVVNWVGDGYCDDGSYAWNGNPIYFDCPEFNYDEGDCPVPMDTVPGCIDMLALNYVPEANFNDGSCVYPVFGCTDVDASNYNPWAEADDGSCNINECSNGEALMILELTLDQYPSETGFILTDISNGQYIKNVPPGTFNYNQSNSTISYEVCVPETGVELILSDTYGDGLAGSLWGGVDGDFVILGDLEPCGNYETLWSLPEANFGGVAYSGVIQLLDCEIPPVFGCTDNSYIEFNPPATIDDGSCENLHIPGCINWTSFNYNPEATINEIIPVCNYTLIIEDDGGDGWGESYIGVVQGDSIVGTYTMGPGYYSQEFNIQLETDKSVSVYYFEIGGPQQPQAEITFQTMHNSFRLINGNGITTLQGGIFPFSNNGAGVLQSYSPPFWYIYNAAPYCGDYCIPTVLGCLDEMALNYDSLANTDNGECIEPVYGCTNDLAFNYDSLANVNDGSCLPVIVGCMDTFAWNYNFLANVDDGSCLYFGCTDPLADNYDSQANVDNGSCFTTVLGCTDPEAFNYNEEANTEDFSCAPVIYGCLDSLSFNYDSLANTNNDACIDVAEGCLDASAYNYDITANTDDNSCLYDAGCIGEPGDPYWLNDTCYAWVIVVDPYCCNNEWDIKCQELYWSCSYGTPLNIEELMEDNSVVIHPNPTKDVVNITAREALEIKVFDIIGNLIIYWDVPSDESRIKTNQLDMSLLSPGIYNFSIMCNNNTISKKVIKQ